MSSVTTIRQEFYKGSPSSITLEQLPFSSLTPKSVSDLVATLGRRKRLGVAASYGEKCCLNALAFSTQTRVLLLTMDETSRSAKRQKQFLRNDILCNDSLQKHGFFVERLAAALYCDLSLQIRNAFDIASDGNKRGSMAAYNGVLEQARELDIVNEPFVKRIFAEHQFTPATSKFFALRAWACCIAVQALPDMPGVIDTSTKDPKARSGFPLRLTFIYLTFLTDRS